MTAPPHSPFAVRWCQACEVGALDDSKLCWLCGEPMGWGHPRVAGMCAEGGMAVG